MASPRLVVARYAPWAAALILLGILGMAIGGGYLTYREASLVCTRAAPAATPRCEATDRNGGARKTVAFDLAADQLKIREHENDDTKHVVLDVPGLTLAGAVDRSFADQTVAGARAFEASGSTMRWEAHTTSRSSWYWALGTLAMLIPLAFIFRAVTVEIDAGAAVVRVTSGRWLRGNTVTHAFGTLRTAVVESIDDSAFYSLVFVAGGGRAVVAQGRESDVKAAARAVNLALRDRRKNMAEMPSELRDELESAGAEFTTSKDAAGLFAGWGELDEPARWQCMETFLQAMPIDDRRVVRKKAERRIEVRGRKRGHPIRVVFDPTSPSGAEVEVKAKGKLGFLDLEYDSAAKEADEPPADDVWDKPGERRTFFAEGVFVEGAKAASSFRSMPEDLRVRIATTMRAERIRYFRVRPEETTASCHDDLLEHRDPAAHLSAVIELAADAAAYAATHGGTDAPQKPRKKKKA